MSLSTEFQGIAENKTDERIDALHQEIQRQLEPKLTELRQTLALARNTSRWYSDNTADHVHTSYESGQAVERDTVEARITVNDGDLNVSDGESIINALEAAMNERPNPGVITWLKGQAREQREGFLTKLKEQGEAILANADTAIEKANARVTETREAGWQSFADTRTFYTELANAVIQNDQDALTSALAAETAISSSAKSDLISRPLAGQPTGMLAITEMESVEPKKEGEVVARVLSAIGNDHKAMNIINGTVAVLDDGDKKSRYQAYASAFIGNYVPFGARSVFSAGHILDAWYDDDADKLKWRTVGGRYGTVDWSGNMNKEDAEGVLRHLYSQPQYVKFSETSGFKAATIIEAWYNEEEGKLKWQTGTGRYGYQDWSRNADIETAKAILDHMEEKGFFVRVRDTQILNAASMRTLRYDQEEGKLKWRTAGGRYGYVDHSQSMSENQARSIIDKVAERDEFVTMPGGYLLNARAVNKAHYDQEAGILVYYLAGGQYGYNEWSIETDQETAKAALENISQAGGHFVQSNELSIINATGIMNAYYQDGKLNYNFMGGKYGYNEWSGERSQEDAERILSDVQENGDFIELGATLLNARALLRAYYEDGKLHYTCSGGKYGYNEWTKTMDEDQARDVLDQIAKRPNIAQFASGGVFNLGAVVDAHYDHEQGKMKWSTSGGKYGTADWSRKMDAEEADAFIKQLRHSGQRQGLMRTYALQKDELRYALGEARAWETDYRSTHDSDTLMDYLPLIIVGAIILFDGNEQAHADTHDALGFDADGAHDLDTADAGIGESAFEGMGVDDDFANASGLDGMEAAIDNDLGVDSFEADFADMDTGMDADGFDSFDSGSSGFDAGSSSDFGGGSDFGGFGLD